MAAAGSKALPRVAVGQLNSTGDHAANLAQAEKLCEDAAAAGANLLCLPEAFSFIGASPQETISQAEALDGPRLEQYRTLARRHGQAAPRPPRVVRVHSLAAQEDKLRCP